MNINSFDFFELLGMQNILAGQKEKMAQEISAIIWERFLTEEIEKNLAGEEIKSINRLVEEGKSPEEIIDFIAEKVPNFKKSFVSFTEKVKIEMIRDHFRQISKRTTELLAKAEDPNKKKSLQQKLDLYTKAEELARNEKWSNLHNLMKKTQK